MRCRLAPLVGALAVMLTGAAPALAATPTYDGHSSSTNESFVDSGDFRDTRSNISWYDAGRGKSGTWIKFAGCRFTSQWRGNPEPRVQLRRQRPGLIPDETRGTKNYATCATGSSANFGGQPTGTYHFDVIDVDVTLSSVHTLQIERVTADY